MNRRLFAGQLAAGLALHLVPTSLMAGSSLVGRITHQPITPPFSDQAAELVQSGLIGRPQRLTISHVYSPERTSLPTLLTIAEQDFDLAARLVGASLAIDAQTIFTDPPSAAFGSYSACFSRFGMTVVWQGLASIGRPASAPTDTLRLFGSKGILQLAADGLSYQFVDFQGRVRSAENQVDSIAGRFTRRSLFSA